MSLFGRHFWMIRLLGIATASAMAGSAASSALAMRIVDGSASVFGAAAADTGEEALDDEDADDEPAAAEVLAQGPTAAQTQAREDLSRKLATQRLETRNPFCPQCVEATPPVLAMADGVMPTAAAPVSKLPLELQATMEAEDPARSLATIYDVERNIVGIYGRGDEIRPGVLLTSVDLGSVQLQRGSGFERLDVGVAVEPAAPEKPAPKDGKPATEEKPAAAGDGSISCASETHCTVERAFVEDILANPAKFAAQAPRVLPVPTGGFKVSGVKKGSLATQLGLKSGDVILAVNGETLGGIDDVMGLVTKLRRASNLSVSLERKGKAIEKNIEIR